MSFLKRLMKSNSNNNVPKVQSVGDTDGSIKRKVDRKLIMCQSDPEPILDLSGCELNAISVEMQTTIKIYAKTDCRFDENRIQDFAVDSVQHMSRVCALHLSYNRIHTIGHHISQLIHLKELYLSHNQLSSLPDSMGRLPALKILAIRDNQFTAFPDAVTRCPALTCLDMADNLVTALPASLLRLRLLKSLQLEGNPIESPAPDVCRQGLDAIVDALQRMYGNEDCGNGCDNNGSDGDECRGLVSDSGDEKDPILETIEYQNYHNLKDQKKRALIEWELQFQSSANSEADSTAGDHKKRQLLAQIWDSERQMSADINSRQRQKDRERQILLDSISQLDRHSAQLLDNIYNWDERHRNQVEALESAEKQLLERMLRYDKEVVLRKNAILIAMHEMLTRESTQRALTDDLKEFNQLEIRVKINQQERLQLQAFEALQRTRDYRSRQLTGQIGLIEWELTQLTSAEMQRRDERMDTIMADIIGKRRELAQLLTKLLAQKRQRDQQLRQQVLEIERRRLEVGAADDTDYWLIQYQCLMERQPMEAQIRQLGIDERIGRALIAVHSECDRMANYLTLFTDLTYDRLNSMGDKQILGLGVDDYHLCQLIRDKLDEQQVATAGASGGHTSALMATAVQPSAPNLTQPLSMPSAPEVTNAEPFAADVDLIQLSGQLSDVRLWREAECVVCFEKICSVVFLPCGHVCTCAECSLLINACPLCRVTIDQKLGLK